MRDIERILTCVSGLCETQQINRIEDVRFALTVETDEAVEFGGKLKRSFADVAIVENI